MRHVIRCLAIVCCAGVGLHALPAEARRVALVIGNAEYKIGPLANPLNDAAAVAAAFEKQLRFDKVILRTNLGFEGFRTALAELSREATGAELGVVYFAGHGTEVAGRNFLIPVDATLGRASALDLEAIPLDTVLGQLDGVRRLKLVILDACRNNLFALPGARRSVSRGLARIEPEDNTLVVYAARDGTTADDGAGRRHSPFTEALLKHIATPGLEINFVFRRVRDDVVAATNPVQTPHVYGTLASKEFYLQPQTALAAASPPAVPPQGNEAAEAWAAVKDSTSAAQLEVIATRYKGTVYADLAQARIDELNNLKEGNKLALVTPAPESSPASKNFTTTYAGPLTNPPEIKYFAFRKEILAREGPGATYGSKFVLREKQDVRALGLHGDARFEGWLKFATLDGHEGFAPAKDLMTEKQFGIRLKILDQNEKIDSYLDRMKRASGSLAKYAGIYDHGGCMSIDVSPNSMAFNLGMALTFRYLIWSEGNTLYQVQLLAPETPRVYRYTARNTINLDGGVGRVQLYTMTSQTSHPNEVLGFTKTGFWYHKGGSSYGFVKYCGTLDSGEPYRLRSMLERWAEDWPTNPGAK